MHFAVHWVKEPKLKGKGHGIPVQRMLDMFLESARRHHPDAEFVFLTDDHTPSPSGPWTVLRVKRRDANVMGHMMRARVFFLSLYGENVVFCDADTLICRPLDDLFVGEWSMTVAWVPKYLNGVMLLRDPAFGKHFFQTAHDRIRDLEPIYQLFGSDLSVTKDMIMENDAGIRKEHCDRICRTTPDTLAGYDGWSPGDAYILNFKGGRKRYMEAAFCRI